MQSQSHTNTHNGVGHQPRGHAMPARYVPNGARKEGSTAPPCTTPSRCDTSIACCNAKQRMTLGVARVRRGGRNSYQRTPSARLFVTLFTGNCRHARTANDSFCFSKARLMAQEAATAKSQVEIAHREKLRTMSLPTSPPRPPTAAGEAPAGAGGVRTEDGCISTFQVLCRTRCGAGCSCVLAASTRSIMFHHFRWSLCWFSSAARCSRRRYDVVGTSAIVTACARGRACGGVPDQRRRRSVSCASLVRVGAGL